VELKKFFRVLKKRWLLIFIVTVVLASASAGWSYFIAKPVYKAEISVIIGKVDDSNTITASSPSMTYNDVMMYQKMVKTYSEFAKSITVAEHAINTLGLSIKAEELVGSISVTPIVDTEFLTISVKSRDSRQAMDIANQLAKSLKEVSQQVKRSDNVQILDGAKLPSGQVSPKPILNIVIALFLGITISVGFVFLLEYLDSTVKTHEDIERLLGAPVIGVIPFVTEGK
jgi:capsular polysaccharide biosynthesis protein